MSEDYEPEKMPPNAMPGMADIVSKSELKETLEELNDDTIEPDTRMTRLDMRTRLAWPELNSLVAFDTLVALRFLPVNCLAFTRQKKRLNISLDGLGRTEMVQSITGRMEQQAGRDVRKFFGGGNKQVGQN